MPFVKAICFLTFIRFVMLVTLGTSLLMGSPCFSQDVSQDNPQDVSLEQLQKQWSELETKFAEKEAAAQADGADVDALRAEYQTLVDQANQLMKKIDQAAIAKLATTPNDPIAVRARMGIMLNEAQDGEFATAMSKGEQLIKSGINPRYFEIASKSERISIAAKEVFDELLIRQAEAKADDLPRVKFTTSQGDIVVELFENEAPETVGNFISLVENEQYTDMLFHRVIDQFIAQGGGFKLDAEGKETGGEGPGYKIKCECYTPDRRLHFTHSLSMAHTGRDTGGSEFFLTLDRTSFLDGRHTCFGRIVEGVDTLDKLTRTHISGALSQSGREAPIADVTKDKIVKAEVIRKRDHEYLPNKVVTVKPVEAPAASDDSKPGNDPIKNATPEDPKTIPPAGKDDGETAADSEPDKKPEPDKKSEPDKN